MTANGSTHTTEEATTHVCDSDMFVQVQFLKESPAVLLGYLYEEDGCSYEWHPGQPLYLIRNGRTSNQGETEIPEWLQPFTEGSTWGSW